VKIFHSFFLCSIIFKKLNVSQFVSCENRKKVTMTEQNETKKYNNVFGISKNHRKDGMPSTTLGLKGLFINNNPTIKTVKDGQVVFNFPSNLQLTDFKKKSLQFAMNGMEFVEGDFGIPVNVSIFIKDGSKQMEFLTEKLVKGAMITEALGVLTTNTYKDEASGETRTSLKLNIDPFNINYIRQKGENGGDGAPTNGAEDFKDGLPF
jgi:hypothetical protein